MKKIVSLILCIISLWTCTSCSSTKINKLYDPENTDIRLTMQFLYLTDDDSSSNSSDFHDALEASANFDGQKNIENVSDKSTYMRASQLLSDFFMEVYDLDVSKDLGKIQTYEYDQDNVSSIAYHIHDTSTIYVNRSWIKDFTDNDLIYTWVHEAIHYLGFYNTPENLKYIALYEASTAAITNRFLDWANLKVTNTDGYALIAQYMMQIFECDPSLITDQISGNAKIEDTIQDRLSNATYPNKDPGEFSIAHYFSMSMEALLNDSNYNTQLTFGFAAQEITTAYCRTFSPSNKTIAKLRKWYPLPNYEDIVV